MREVGLTAGEEEKREGGFQRRLLIAVSVAEGATDALLGSKKLRRRKENRGPRAPSQPKNPLITQVI